MHVFNTLKCWQKYVISIVNMPFSKHIQNSERLPYERILNCLLKIAHSHFVKNVASYKIAVNLPTPLIKVLTHTETETFFIIFYLIIFMLLQRVHLNLVQQKLVWNVFKLDQINRHLTENIKGWEAYNFDMYYKYPLKMMWIACKFHLQKYKKDSIALL